MYIYIYIYTYMLNRMFSFCVYRSGVRADRMPSAAAFARSRIYNAYIVVICVNGLVIRSIIIIIMIMIMMMMMMIIIITIITISRAGGPNAVGRGLCALDNTYSYKHIHMHMHNHTIMHPQTPHP